MSSRRTTLVTRAVGAAAALAAVLTVLHLLGLLGNTSEGLSVGDATRAQERAPGVDLHVGDTEHSAPTVGARSEGTPQVVSSGRVEVVENPGDGPLPINDGLIVIRGAQGELTAAIEQGGEWKLELDEASVQGDLTIEEVWRGGERLGFYPVGLEYSDRHSLIAYGYDGVFIDIHTPDGEELKKVSVRHRPKWRASAADLSAAHPGNLGLTRLVVDNAPTPVYVPSLDPMLTGYWVTSPGYSWGHVPSSKTSGGGLEDVELRSCGSLLVNIEGFSVHRELRLYVESGERIVATYNHLDQDSCVIDGLPPSGYTVYLSLDPMFVRGSALGNSGVVRVEAGVPSKAVIKMPHLPTTEEYGELHGVLTVEFPEQWSMTEAFSRLALRVDQSPPTPGFVAVPRGDKFVRLSEMKPTGVESAARTWEWGPVSLPEGEYSLVIEPFGSAQAVTVSRQGASFAECHVPPVAISVVTLLDNGEEVQPQRVNAYPVKMEGRSSMDGEFVEATDGEGAELRLVSLPGLTNITGKAAGYPPFSQRAELQAGWNYVEVSLTQQPQAVLRAVDPSGNEVSLGKAWYDMQAAGTEGGAVRITSRELAVTRVVGDPVRKTILTAYFPEAGEYYVQFPSLPSGLNARPTTITASILEPGSEPEVFEVVIDGN